MGETAEKSQCLHATASGRVQGVGFRHYTMLRAREIGVSGWVRNLPDGAVEVTAEGTRDQLEALLAFLHQGPPAARVIQVDVLWGAATGAFDGFEIRY
jgi:acylphosphatase